VTVPAPQPLPKPPIRAVPGITALSSLAIRPSSFHPAASGPSFPRALKPGTGATISYAVPSASSAVFTVLQASPRRPARKVEVGTFKHSAPSGRTNLRFSGRLKGTALRPGRYLLQVVAQSNGMNPSAPLMAPFRVLR
jgi:hypothetical protein